MGKGVLWTVRLLCSLLLVALAIFGYKKLVLKFKNGFALSSFNAVFAEDLGGSA